MTPAEQLYQYLLSNGLSPRHARALVKTRFEAPQQEQVISYIVGTGEVKLSAWTAPEQHEADIPAVTAEYEALLKRLKP